MVKARKFMILIFALTLLSLVMLVQAQDTATIAYGDTVENSLTEEAPRAAYAFEGMAGDQIVITLTSDEFDAYLVLQDASGEAITEDDDSAGNFNAEITFTLPQNGTYTIIVTSLRELLSGGSFFSVGAYNLSLESTGNMPVPAQDATEEPTAEPTEEPEPTQEPTEEPTVEPSVEPTQEPTEEPTVEPTQEPAVEENMITVGETVDGMLTEALPSASYSFDASAGDLITITVVSSEPNKFDTYLLLLDADGLEVASDDDGAGDLNSRIGPFTIPEDGEYTIVVDSFDNFSGGVPSTGSYSLSLTIPEIEVIDMNEAVEGTLGGDSPIAIYSFSGSAGDVVTVTLDAEGYSVYMVLTQANEAGGLETYGEPGVTGPVMLPDDGEYLITVNSYDTYEMYDFSLIVETLDSEALSLNQAMDVNFDETGLHFYSFEGQAGDAINVIVNSDGSVDTEVTVTGPDGFEIAYDDDSGAGFDPEIRGLMLPQDGTYTLLVRPYVDGDNGNFSLLVENGALPSLEGKTQIVRISDKNPEGVVTFSGLAGENVVLNVRVLAGAENDPRISVYQDEELIAESTIGFVKGLSIEFTIPESGPVHVYIVDDFFGQSVLQVSVDRAVVPADTDSEGNGND